MSRSDARRTTRRATALGVVLALSLAGSAARAAEPESVQRARSEFLAATEHVKNARWGEALAAFERSVELRPHALTTFNIGACERALGRYTRARTTLLRAIEANEAATRRELAPSFVSDAKKWIEEIDGILVRATVNISPIDAAVLVDGAPLASTSTAGEYVAGVGPTGPTPLAATNADGRFVLVLDPGVHVFSFSKAGFENAVVTKTVTPGTKPEIALDLQKLPATIYIGSKLPSSVVTLNDLDVGIAPVELTRPAGSYRVGVRKVGFVPYENHVTVKAGESARLEATLTEETKPITKQWWFWTVAAAVVAGAATTTYFATRPEPQRPAPDGGGLGWVVAVPPGR